MLIKINKVDEILKKKKKCKIFTFQYHIHVKRLMMII